MRVAIHKIYEQGAAGSMVGIGALLKQVCGYEYQIDTNQIKMGEIPGYKDVNELLDHVITYCTDLFWDRGGAVAKDQIKPGDGSDDGGGDAGRADRLAETGGCFDPGWKPDAVGLSGQFILAEIATRWRVELRFWDNTKAGWFITLLSLLTGLGWMQLFLR